MKNFIIISSFMLSSLMSVNALSHQDHEQEYNQAHQSENQQLSEAELAQILAPIALYPDSLLTHILISSTYPIEVIEAYRWLENNDNLTASQIARKIEKFEWDASVKALVPFKQILSRLSDNLTWMQQLGDAFLQDEELVLESIQALREQAKLSGNLDKMENMEVSYERNNIIIEPVQKEIVYVPYYDTRLVYGNWHWSSYPPVYWTPHHRVYINHHNPFSWHTGIHISFNYFFSSFHWHKRHLVVVNSHRTHSYRSRKSISRGGYAKRWSHKPVHRRGVSYGSKKAHKKYYSGRVKAHKINKQSHASHRKFEQRLSATKHSARGKANKVNHKSHNESLRHRTKSKVAKVNHDKLRASKKHSLNKSHKPKNIVKNSSPKPQHKKVERRKQQSARSNNTRKSSEKIKRHKQNRSSFAKTHRTKVAKVRHQK